MVQTRSGLAKEPETLGWYCHQNRQHVYAPIGSMPEGGLKCCKCHRFWCKNHLKDYAESTRNGPPSEWLCYYCNFCCTCSECKRLGRNLQAIETVVDDDNVNEALAVDDQVKGKRKRVASMRDLAKKVKIMELEKIKLQEEAEACKNHAANHSQIVEEHEDLKIRFNQQAKEREELYNKVKMMELEKIKLQEEAEACKAIQSQIVEKHEDLKIRFNQQDQERKELYNKIQELRGNIRVYVRCRPLTTKEIAEGASMAFDFEGSKDGELRVKSNPALNFKFDSVFSPEATQAEVCEDASTFATSLLDGFNICIFAYGQTGTGKTFTMEGTNENRGVNFRTLEELFRVIDERKNQIRYQISVSSLEVYNDQLRDLLFPSSQPGAVAKSLHIREDGEGKTHVVGLFQKQVQNLSDVWKALEIASKARAVGSTNANEHSSCSHCMHCVIVQAENLQNGKCTRSKLWLVDLAGSESAGKTQVQGERLTEANCINTSISALGNVISALAANSIHIPYRDVKLTHLLKDSLGGGSKTLLFVQISPHKNDLSESMNSLNFANRARKIELGPAKKQIVSEEVLKYKQMMKEKDQQIMNLETKVKETELKNRNLKDRVKVLESQLVAIKLARRKVDPKIAEQKQQHQNQPESILSRQPSKPPDRSKQRQSTKQHHPAT